MLYIGRMNMQKAPPLRKLKRGEIEKQAIRNGIAIRSGEQGDIAQVCAACGAIFSETQYAYLARHLMDRKAFCSAPCRETYNATH